MKFALFLGCNIPARLVQFESSSRAVLRKLGVELVDVKEFNCCGYPMRNIDFKVFLLASARNLALSRKMGLNLLALCKCCYGSLKKADYLLKEHSSLRKEVNGILEREGLRYEGSVEVRHLLSLLYDDIGLAAIKEKTEKVFKGLRIATHYGCHALRPSSVVRFDDPVAPFRFDRLVEATGAESVSWPMKLDCCGAPLWGVNDELSMNLTFKKLVDAKESGADYLCAACPYCHIQFDTVQKMILTRRNIDHPVPSVLYPQLLGLSMGIDGKALGLEMNQLSITGIEKLITEQAELPTS
jgi:heterodisulfide reductase subunit B